MPKKEGGKKKKSAAEIAAEKARIEEEQRKAEEEAKRRLAELERLRAEAEAKRQEELRIAREEEKERLSIETQEDAPLLHARAVELQKLQYNMSKNKEWNEYIHCSSLPKPDIDAELNTYITIYEQDNVMDMKNTLEAFQVAEDVVASIESVIAASAEERQTQKVAHSQSFIQALRNVSYKKLDALTAKSVLLQNPESVIEDPRLSTEAIDFAQTQDLRFGLWVRCLPVSSGNNQAGMNANRIKPVVFRELNITVDLPKTLATMVSSTTAFRILHTSFDPHAESNTGPYMAVGGVCVLQFLGVPPAPHRARDWIMREITELTETCVIRPFPVQSDNSALQQYIRITYPLPRTLVFNPDQLQVANWDDKESAWMHDNVVSDIKYNPADRTVSFQVAANRLHPVAVVQYRALDFPYYRWSLTPTSASRATLILEGSRFPVHIEIVEGEVQLVQPTIPALADLQYKLMQPGVLLHKLASCGINLLPADRDADHSNLTPKHPALELSVHDQLSQIVPTFELCGSVLNHAGGSGKVYVQARPAFRRQSNSASSADDSSASSAAANTSGILSGEWITMQVNAEKVMALKSNIIPGAPHSNAVEKTADEQAASEDAESSENQNADQDAAASNPDGSSSSEAAASSSASPVPAATPDPTAPDANAASADGSDPQSTYLTPDQAATADEALFEPSHASVMRCLLEKCTDEMKSDLYNPNIRFQDTVRKLLNLVRALSFDHIQ